MRTVKFLLAGFALSLMVSSYDPASEVDNTDCSVGDPETSCGETEPNGDTDPNTDIDRQMPLFIHNPVV